MENNQGHRYMLCVCREEHVCACGCGQTIRVGDKGIEHSFYKDGKFLRKFTRFDPNCRKFDIQYGFLNERSNKYWDEE